MASERMRQLIATLTGAPMVYAGEPVSSQRAKFDGMADTFLLPDDVTVSPQTAGGVPCEWVSAAGTREDHVCVYLHGGGYVIGSLRSHREVASRYSRALNARTLLVDYRLAPEHPCPAALEDAVSTYEWLLGTGVAPEDVVLCGESAGGGLSIATLAAIKQAGLPLPACAAVVSPWADLTFSGASYAENPGTDPIIIPGVIAEYREWVTVGTSPDDPRISPVFADLAGLPPVLVAVSRAEVIRDDGLTLVERLETAGVEVETEMLDDAVHAWTLFPYLPEAVTTLERVAEFVRSRTPAPPEAPRAAPA